MRVTLVATLEDRLVMVTGKGGTGKTAVAAALARLHAAKGRRTLLCEVDTQRTALAPIFRVPEPGVDPVRVTERLHVCNLVWPDVLGAYLQSMVRVKRLADAIIANDAVRRFLDFTPGSQEVVVLSVLADMVERYDVVVVDMPASGHAFSMLDITRSALGLFRGGPLRTRAKELRALVQDVHTRMVFVALPEEMVVNETAETVARMRESGLIGGAPIAVLNRAITPTFNADEQTLLEALDAASLPPAAEELVASGIWKLGLEEAMDRSQSRLTELLGDPPVVVPPVNEAAEVREIVGGICEHLAPSMGLDPKAVAWT